MIGMRNKTSIDIVGNNVTSNHNIWKILTIVMRSVNLYDLENLHWFLISQVYNIGLPRRSTDDGAKR